MKSGPKPKYSGVLNGFTIKEYVGKGKYIFLCKYCQLEFKTDAWSIKSGHTKSCGCKTGNFIAKILTKHGHAVRNSKSSEYKSWVAMVSRCYTLSNVEYNNYGGKGIVVCDRWLGESGFSNFIADMGEKPTPTHTLDRFPNISGNYEPSNCRWATPLEQSNNRKTTIYYTLNNETKALGIWCDQFGVPFDRVYRRLKYGWELKDALTRKKISPGTHRLRNRLINHSFGFINYKK